jgi:hypothetical protein
LDVPLLDRPNIDVSSHIPHCFGRASSAEPLVDIKLARPKQWHDFS